MIRDGCHGSRCRFLFEALLVWIDVLVHEALQPPLQFLRLRAEFKVHMAAAIFAGEDRRALFDKMRDAFFEIFALQALPAFPARKSQTLRQAFETSRCTLARLITRNDRGLTFEASSSAYSCTFSMKRILRKNLIHQPIRNASAASISRAENSKSSAFAGPTRRGNIHAIPYSAINPRSANAVPNRAASEAKRKSQYNAITNPRPTAGPLIGRNHGLLDRREI